MIESSDLQALGLGGLLQLEQLLTARLTIGGEGGVQSGEARRQKRRCNVHHLATVVHPQAPQEGAPPVVS